MICEGSEGYVDAVTRAVSMRLDDQACTFEGRSSAWGEVLDRAARIAGGLQAMGVRPGDRVGVLSPNSDIYLVLYLAIPWAGAVLVPLNARWTSAENAVAIDDCGLKALFVSPELATLNREMLAERPVALISIDPEPVTSGCTTLDLLLEHGAIADMGRTGSDLFAIFYTGGTTGRPKGVMLSNAGFVSNVVAMRDLGICRDGCRMLVAAPLFHLAAAAAMTMAMLGGSAVITRSFDPTGTIDLVAQEHVTDALLVPTMMQLLLDAPDFVPSKLAGLETVLYGASPMPEATLDRMMEAAPHLSFFQAYGMTEVSCTAAVLTPEFHEGEHRAAGRHRGAGQPLATAEIMIADAQGRPLPVGEVGEILVRGQGVMLGYWNLPELTQEALRDGWMHTGDGGRLDDQGILYVVDRLKDMIVSGGENVYSAEVESALSHHPDIAQCAVIGVPDHRWGERVHAVIVTRPGAELASDTVVQHCRTLIAGYKCPRSIEFRTSLPVSAAGKVAKAELRATYWKESDRNVA